MLLMFELLGIFFIILFCGIFLFDQLSPATCCEMENVRSTHLLFANQGSRSAAQSQSVSNSLTCRFHFWKRKRKVCLNLRNGNNTLSVLSLPLNKFSTI